MKRLYLSIALLMAACGAQGQDLDDILADEEPSDDLLGAARRAVEEQKRKKEAEEAARRASIEAAEERERKWGMLWEQYRKVKHPRILVTPARLAAIRRDMKVPGSHTQLAYDSIRNNYRGELTSEWLARQEWLNVARNKRWPAQVVRDLALLSLISEDPAEQRRYAEASARFLPSAGAFLSLHFTGNLGTPVGVSTVSMAYDWGYNQFTEEERTKYESVMASCLDNYGEGDVTERQIEKRKGGAGYNHFGVKTGPDVLVRLAVGSERGSRGYERAVKLLGLYFEGVGGELGAHMEGLGYTEYPMSTALPAALAAAELGDPRLVEVAGKHAFWLLNMYAQTFMTSYDRKFIQYGADHQSNFNQGFATCVFGLCPEESLPYYLWFYDRHMGRLSKGEPELRFDSHRNTTGLALLLYPYGLQARDPTSVLPKGVVDRKHGYCFFRNRWRDENDIQVALLAGNLRRAGGWNQYEHLGLRLMAYDTRFFGGPGKERTPENYTTLLVDGALAGDRDPELAKSPEGRHGRLVAFETTADGGYAIVDKDKSGPCVGIRNATRHLLVRYSDAEKNTAILSTLDLIASEEEHTYTWQANLGPPGVFTKAAAPAGKAGAPGPSGKTAVKLKLPSLEAGTGAAASDGLSLDEPEEKKLDDSAEPAAKTPKSGPEPSDDGIVSTQSMEGGRPFFLLKGRKGYVKGWVLYPADAAVKTGDPLQLTTKGAEAKIWVVMYVGAGEPAKGAIEGTGMDTVLRVAGRKVTFDGKRIKCK